VRVLAAVVLALGFTALPVLSATTAFASGCAASVSDPYPTQNETVTVSFTGPASTAGTVVAHYHTVDNTATTTTDTSGKGQVGFNIGGAAYGETVVVNVVVGSDSCSTSFEPRAPTTTTTTAAPSSSSSTSTTSTTAVLTGLNSGSTTTTGDPPVKQTVAAATSSAVSSLAFTGNATWIEAGAGVLLVGLGVFFLGSARRRQELVRLLWPDER